MENLGLVIFSPSGLIYREDIMTVNEKFNVLEIILHELVDRKFVYNEIIDGDMIIG